MAKTPEKYLKNVKEGKITERMLEECIISVSAKALHQRNNEIKYENYGHDWNTTYSKGAKESKESYYKQKRILLSILEPSYIQKDFLGFREKRIYEHDEDYKNHEIIGEVIWADYYYDSYKKKEVNYFDILTDESDFAYYLCYEINNNVFRILIDEKDLDKYKNLEIISTNNFPEKFDSPEELSSSRKRKTKPEKYNIKDLLSCQFCAKVIELIENGKYIFEK